MGCSSLSCYKDTGASPPGKEQRLISAEDSRVSPTLRVFTIPMYMRINVDNRNINIYGKLALPPKPINNEDCVFAV